MSRTMRWALGVLLLAALLAGDALVTARLVTKRMNRAESAPAYSRIGSDPMAAFRLEREQLRARQEAQLNDVIHDADAEGETRAQARRVLLDMLAHPFDAAANCREVLDFFGCRETGEAAKAVAERVARVLRVESGVEDSGRCQSAAIPNP